MMAQNIHLASVDFCKPNHNKPKLVQKPATLPPAVVASCERSFQTQEENIWRGLALPACMCSRVYLTFESCK